MDSYSSSSYHSKIHHLYQIKQQIALIII